MKLILGVIIGIIICVLVAIGYYAFSNYQITPKTTTLAEQPKDVLPTLQQENTIVPTSTIAVTVPAEKNDKDLVKTVSGNLGYPSSFVPALKICLYEYVDKTSTQGPKYCTETKTNQMSYQISGSIAPAKYVIFAWVSDADAGSELAGSYTPAIVCGLSVDCKDHAPIILDLMSENNISGVDIKDWYADAGIFPKKPIDFGIQL